MNVFYLRFLLNKDRTIRQRIGSWLRRLAMKIDYRGSIAVELDCFPAIPPMEVQECISAGMDRAHDLLLENWRGICAEALMREHRPALYEDEK